MQPFSGMTFEEGCEKHFLYCRQRNLSETTLIRYRACYSLYYKFFDRDMPLSKIDAEMYNAYILYLRDRLDNAITIKSYLRTLIAVLHYLMREGDLPSFKLHTIKAGESHKETYTDEELYRLLEKPNRKKCTFIQYQSWVITNFLFCTGVRSRSLVNIQVKDIDFENSVAVIRVTKNRKVLIIPLNQTLVMILKEFLKYRQHKSPNDWLFCNVYGEQLKKGTCYVMLSRYNKSRGVETTGLHRYRHTFAKQWILNGGNVVSLSRLLGHSSLNITQNYINLLTTDLAKQVDEINLLDKYAGRKRIKM